ncbi:uncharacterized protein LOC136087014 [Hydra vulgaris]|uniref:Uncharacterized protein LOC136087014 n=1 Tax=Hydra vulgaris TaxID=6087 RepID=A0ABM4CUI5_HYDVU
MPLVKSVGLKKQGCIVPFLDTLSFLLQSPEIAKFIDHKISIAIYSDDLGITNPIGKAQSKHKLWAMYFQIPNIPAKYRGRTSTIFPLAFTGSKMGKDSFFLCELLCDFFDVMSKLTTGIELTVLGVPKVITGELCYFSGDSLAANAIGGFKEGFSRKTVRCCRVCNSTRGEMYANTRHEQCSIRDLKEHLIRLKELDSGLRPKDRIKWSKYYGISSSSVLLSIPLFDVTKQILFDPMHDLLEGVVPLQLELFLGYAVKSNFITVSSLNTWLQSFIYPVGIEKPGLILKTCKIKGSFGSGQILTLTRVLPFFLLKNFLPHNEHLKCLLKLIQIVQLCMSPMISEKYLTDLKEIIAVHHELFLGLYPLRFIPKLHFLKHYPVQASTSGPLREHMCIAFERKHQVVKNY